MDAKIKSGDRVKLISGSTVMTIGSINDKYAELYYWDDNKFEIIHVKIEIGALQLI